MTVSIKEVQRLLKRVQECDEWIKEFGNRSHPVWGSALDGVNRSRQNYVAQLEKYGIVDEVV